ncbi:uncharacterized protein LOC106640990 [Copidosoma floridanum]|uniref:uncharacterized protein LOC106640990 n=1 Tax=Copidosoma floridanum TaxID=29053 RepID=UPI0006C9763F|nr:uncharacterized protein LOC106640990 [Copidosoma floridanum]
MDVKTLLRFAFLIVVAELLSEPCDTHLIAPQPYQFPNFAYLPEPTHIGFPAPSKAVPQYLTRQFRSDQFRPHDDHVFFVPPPPPPTIQLLQPQFRQEAPPPISPPVQALYANRPQMIPQPPPASSPRMGRQLCPYAAASSTPGRFPALPYTPNCAQASQSAGAMNQGLPELRLDPRNELVKVSNGHAYKISEPISGGSNLVPVDVKGHRDENYGKLRNTDRMYVVLDQDNGSREEPPVGNHEGHLRPEDIRKLHDVIETIIEIAQMGKMVRQGEDAVESRTSVDGQQRPEVVIHDLVSARAAAAAVAPPSTVGPIASPDDPSRVASPAGDGDIIGSEGAQVKESTVAAGSSADETTEMTRYAVTPATR